MSLTDTFSAAFLGLSYFLRSIKVGRIFLVFSFEWQTGSLLADSFWKAIDGSVSTVTVTMGVRILEFCLVKDWK